MHCFNFLQSVSLEENKVANLIFMSFLKHWLPNEMSFAIFFFFSTVDLSPEGSLLNSQEGLNVP